MQIIDIIQRVLEQNDIHPNSEQLNKLAEYYKLVVDYNQNINLTSITEPHEFAVKHFADSLVNYQFYKQNATLCDIGTGAGFPGIPLKIMRPDLTITLVDSLQKRINFLNIVINQLNLQQITTIHSRAQELPQHNVSRETFDYVIARAVAPLNILCEYCLPFVKINGEMIAYKSVNFDNELTEANRAITILGGEFKQNYKFQLKTNTDIVLQRDFVVISKLNKTLDKYPRPKNKIQLNPL